jgi:lipoprotein-anchoring transpeptidase ErfK/SrfK
VRVRHRSHAAHSRVLNHARLGPPYILGVGPDSDNARSRFRPLEAGALVVVVAALAFVVLAARDRPGDPLATSAGTREAAAAAPASATPASTVANPSSVPGNSPEATSVQRDADPDPDHGSHPVVGVRTGRRVILRDSPGGARVGATGDETEFGSPSVFSVARQTEHWVAAPSPSTPNGELAWIRADPRKLVGGYVDYAIHVDLSARQAVLLRRGVEIRRWPVTVGAAGSETPTGRFAVTDTFRGGLRPAYGCCAVALTATQPNLPADWPGGNRIAIHGTDEPLGEAASHGCIRSADRDVRRLIGTVPLGTPVRIDP